MTNRGPSATLERGRPHSLRDAGPGTQLGPIDLAGFADPRVVMD